MQTFLNLILVIGSRNMFNNYYYNNILQTSQYVEHFWSKYRSLKNLVF